MLFNGFSIEGKGNVGGDPWQGHPFNPKNNVNGVDGGSSKAVHTLSNPAITAHQEAYVRKVIDTVNDLDNVLYEITNEDSGEPGQHRLADPHDPVHQGLRGRESPSSIRWA